MNHCSRCDARLRKSKPPWALCDPCDDARHRANIAHEKAEEQARLAAGERPCKHCGQHTAAVRSGIYAWLCNTRPSPERRQSSMTRPRLLDLFCGAGGAAMGYHRAGFDVVGVDIKPQPNYPFQFEQAEALSWLRLSSLLDGIPFDAIHASPPCQRYTAMKTMWNHRGDEHPDLIAPTRSLLAATTLPWVMENVPGAPMEHSVMLCGTMFGLGSGEYELRRHRLFETSFPMLGPTCQHSGKPTIGFYGDHARDRRRVSGSNDRGVDFHREEHKIRLAQDAMDMPWVTVWRGLSEAIPPAYTEYIGTWLLERITEVAA